VCVVGCFDEGEGVFVSGGNFCAAVGKGSICDVEGIFDLGYSTVKREREGVFVCLFLCCGMQLVLLAYIYGNVVVVVVVVEFAILSVREDLNVSAWLTSTSNLQRWVKCWV
jgi:hypothetical protein